MPEFISAKNATLKFIPLPRIQFSHGFATNFRLSCRESHIGTAGPGPFAEVQLGNSLRLNSTDETNLAQAPSQSASSGGIPSPSPHAVRKAPESSDPVSISNCLYVSAFVISWYLPDRRPRPTAKRT